MPQHLRFATKAAQVCFQSKVPAYMLSASFMSHDSEKKMFAMNFYISNLISFVKLKTITFFDIYMVKIKILNA